MKVNRWDFEKHKYDIVDINPDWVVTTKGENPVIEDKDVSVTFNNGVISDEHYYVDDYIYARNKDGETVCYAVVKGKGLFAGQVMIEVEFVTLLEKMNYTYIDWNCLNNDSIQKYSDIQLLNNLKKSAENKNTLVVLMHDTKDVNDSSSVLKESISYLRERGYEFGNFYDLLGDV